MDFIDHIWYSCIRGDDMIIDVEVTDIELEEHRKNLYAAYNEIELEEVDLEDHEQTEKFIEQMNYQGYMTTSEIDAAIKLDLKRNKLAKQMLINDINGTLNLLKIKMVISHKNTILLIVKFLMEY